MPERFLMPWRLEVHPTVKPIPIAVFAFFEDGRRELVFACDKSEKLYAGYKAIVEAHNDSITPPPALPR